ncbi:MAG: hypothetical protein IIB55_03120 [Planctomycetes bacterium]|nr:hypothetical protein [Planctomycetota bacterium]
MTAQPRSTRIATRIRLPALGVVALVIASWMAAASAAGGDEHAATRMVAAGYALLAGGMAPAIYLMAALGLGRLAEPLLRRSRDRWALQLACGIAVMLTVSQVMGVLGLLGSFVAAATPIGVGLVLLAHQVSRSSGERGGASIPWTAVVAIPGAAVLLVAACSPPGWLWGSEFGGYDALSYHLQLPQEWIAAGRVWPIEHNVYSFLPGYVESAFVHVGALMRVPAHGSPGSPLHGLVAGEGIALLSCQFLHAGFTLAAAYIIARLVVRTAIDSGCSERASSAAGGVGAGLVLLTPWTVVVGSLAYNEMAMIALGAGAMLAAAQRACSPTARGLLTGALVGVACGAKPTALLLFGVPAGLVLLGLSPRREWARLLLFGALAGLVSLSPWMIRNAVAVGNPVFPYLTTVFGTAHWSGEQVARYVAGHSFDGSIADRVGLMFFADQADPAGVRHRGLMHAQWGVFFPAVLIACVAAVAARRTRRWGVLLAIVLGVQLLVWLTTTHIQSRFLVPMLVPGAAVFGLVCASLLDADRGAARSARRIVGLCAIGVCLLVQAGMLVAIFRGQGGGKPNALLVAGPAWLSGEIHRTVGPGERFVQYDQLDPAVFINIESPAGEPILFIGESAPLYYRFGIVYSTTWDRSMLASVMREHGDDPAAWTRALLERSPPISYVLYDANMTRRFRRSGTADPVLDPGVIEAWLDGHARLIRSWAGSGHRLFELRGPGDEP